MRVVLVDDHRTFLDSFRIALFDQATIEVAGAVTSARDVFPLVEAEHPDVVVLDLMLGDTDGVSLARELKRRGVTAKLMILTVHENGLFVRDAFDAGVRAYVLKQQPLAEVIEAMQIVARGGRYVAPALGMLPTPEDSRPSDEPSGSASDRLSRREREIFGLIVQGRSSREISSCLHISIKTVETHRAHINRKLGVRSPGELIRLAALQGLLVAPSTHKPASTTGP